MIYIYITSAGLTPIRGEATAVCWKKGYFLNYWLDEKLLMREPKMKRLESFPNEIFRVILEKEQFDKFECWGAKFEFGIAGIFISDMCNIIWMYLIHRRQTS